MKYRSDIDGLRAIAVLAVVLFHAGVPALSGGFLGVDVFYVISGYLITSITTKDIEDREFSLFAFYKRRVARLYPALFTVVAVSTIVALALFTPRDLKEYARSAIASTLYVSNIFFWKGSGYFETDSQLKPLLHTWSLSVEEQFYIVFPVLLFLLLKGGRKIAIPGLIALAMASLALAQWASVRYPPAAFYLSPPRAWELLSGAVLALSGLRQPKNGAVALGAGVLGILLILAPCLIYTSDAHFPGLAAVVPVLGALLILYSGTADRPNPLLSNRPMVFIGKISYSMYLWHWPVLAFLRYYEIRPLNPLEATAAVVATFVLSVLTWMLVERPGRAFGVKLSNFRALGAGAALMAVGCAAFAGVLAAHGFPTRVSPQVRRISNYADDRDRHLLNCQVRDPRQIDKGRLCVIGDQTAPPTWLVWGDSHVAAIGPAIDKWLASHHRSAVIVGADGCPPLLGVRRLYYSSPCAQMAARVPGLIRKKGIQDVLVISSWTNYPQKDLQLIDDPDRDSATAFQKAMDITMAQLASTGAKIYVFEPVPRAKGDAPSDLARAAMFSTPINLDYSLSEYRSMNAAVFSAFDRNARYIAGRVDPSQALCANGDCITTLNGALLYRDDNHLTLTAAPLLQKALAQQLP